MTLHRLTAIGIALSLIGLAACAGNSYSEKIPGSYGSSYKRASEALRARDFDRAREQYAFAASSGHPKAMIAYGRLFVKGQGVDADPVRALALFKGAYDKNSPMKSRAALELGQLLMKGGDGPSGTVHQNEARARDLLMEAFENGELRAATSLARMYEQGLGVERDLAVAIDYYQQAPASDAYAARNLAILLARNGSDQEMLDRAAGRAVNAFEVRGKAGDGRAWMQLAEIYSRNEIVEADLERARGYLSRIPDPDDPPMQMRLAQAYGRIGDRMERNRLMRTAADAGDVRAQTQLARILLEPGTADTNGAVGRYYAERAIGRGSQAAMVHLGRAMLRGDVLEPDPDLGESLLRRAHNDGFVSATIALGAAILEGHVPDSRPDDGKALLVAAADEGSAEAMSALGFAYLYGRGLPEDETLARQWLDRAAKAGSQRARAHLAR